MKTPQPVFGSMLVLVGMFIVFGSRRIAAVTDSLNQRVAGRKYRDARGYVLVGVGIIIVGVAVALGLA